MMIKIVIADDHAVVRSGFSHLLNFQEDMEVIATAADGAEAYELVLKYDPDIILLDVSMPPGESGLIAAAKIHQNSPNTKMIILTMYEEEEYLFQVLKNGASGYVLKRSPDEELLKAIRTVYDGGMYIDPVLQPSLEQKTDESEKENDAFVKLSPRELEVLPLTAKGYSNKEIANMLHVSVKTVEAHKANMMAKLNLNSRPELIEYALKKKLLQF